jgi:hypothetical protein
MAAAIYICSIRHWVFLSGRIGARRLRLVRPSPRHLYSERSLARRHDGCARVGLAKVLHFLGCAGELDEVDDGVSDGSNCNSRSATWSGINVLPDATAPWLTDKFSLGASAPRKLDLDQRTSPGIDAIVGLIYRRGQLGTRCT